MQRHYHLCVEHVPSSTPRKNIEIGKIYVQPTRLLHMKGKMASLFHLGRFCHWYQSSRSPTATILRYSTELPFYEFLQNLQQDTPARIIFRLSYRLAEKELRHGCFYVIFVKFFGTTVSRIAFRCFYDLLIKIMSGLRLSIIWTKNILVYLN